LLLSLALPATAQQAPPAPPSGSPLQLTWVSTEASCTGADVVAEARGLVAPGVTPQPVVARATVHHDPEGWAVRLETRSGNQTGQRSLRGGTCREIQQAIGLLLAMTMESGHLSGEAAPATPTPATPLPTPATPAPAAAPATPRSAAPATEPPRTTTEAPQPRAVLAAGARPAPVASSSAGALSVLVRLDAEAAYGLQPEGVGFGASVGAGVGWKALELTVGASYWPATETPIFSGQGRIEVVRHSFDLSACLRLWDGGSFELVPCLAGELTYLHSRTLDTDVPKTGETIELGSLSGSVDLRYWLPGRVIFLFLKPGITWEKPAVFEVWFNCEPDECDPTPAAETPGIGLRLRAGVGARF